MKMGSIQVCQVCFFILFFFISDSGPLRLARTPSPPEDESPPESPDMSYNNRLRPVSPGPPRPKSPVQVNLVQKDGIQIAFSTKTKKFRSGVSKSSP